MSSHSIATAFRPNASISYPLYPTSVQEVNTTRNQPVNFYFFPNENLNTRKYFKNHSHDRWPDVSTKRVIAKGISYSVTFPEGPFPKTVHPKFNPNPFIKFRPMEVSQPLFFFFFFLFVVQRLIGTFIQTSNTTTEMTREKERER